MTRGSLRVYLGAAPGVGKTSAMLQEGHRRAGRGADVVVAIVETYDRSNTAKLVEGLELVPRRSISFEGVEFAELDVQAVLSRAPQVALVDELAHTNAGGNGHTKRWQDVEQLLAAGIDIISTVNVDELESLHDVVEAIIGMPQSETVPDAFVRGDEQVELIDMTPAALRQRVAHGNVYAPGEIDAALGNYFRAGNLTALRELALIWLADSVDDGLRRYREQHGITATWETRERIVVALSGGPEGETLIRRAARIAARASGGDLLAIHVARSNGVADSGIATLDQQRLLVEGLGGTYHSIVGGDVPTALIEFARHNGASQIVLGASRHRPRARIFSGPGISASLGRVADTVDVHVVAHAFDASGAGLPSLRGALTTRRKVVGLVTAFVLLGGDTVVLAAVRGHLSFASDVCIYLLSVIITSLIGGFFPALGAAVAGSLLLNYYFAPPLHTFTIAGDNDAVSLVIFVLVAVLVSRVVDLAAQRLALAARASAEAETLSTLAGSLLRGEQALPALLERVQETFDLHSVSLLGRDLADPSASKEHWRMLASVGADPPARPSQADCVARIDDRQLLAARGRTLHAADQRVLTAFAAQVAVAYRQRELSAAARAVEPLAESERARTALLSAVGHDLRTPIAAAKTAVSSLRADDVSWSDSEHTELLETADNALDRLTDLVTNLLDLSRLQAEVLPVLASPIGLDDVLARALDHALAGSTRGDLRRDKSPVIVRIPPDLPEVIADAGLLERVLANLIQNALRYSPIGAAITLMASAHFDRVELRVIDTGPGIDRRDTERVFEAFQRHDDASSRGAGVGLGLAIARGFTEAMGGSVNAEQTPGGGATLIVSLPAVAPAMDEGVM